MSTSVDTISQPSENALPLPCAPQRRATRVIFLVSGLTTATWAPLVPFVKDRLALSESALGMLLLCLGLGSFVFMPLAGALCGRLGCRKVIAVSGVCLLSALLLLASVPTIWAMALSLVLFGAGLGTIDVAMNVQSVIVQEASKKAIMSGFHGFYSLGALLGAASMALLLSVGLSPWAAVLCMVGIAAALLAFGIPLCLPYGSRSDAPWFVLPKGAVLLLGVLCFMVFLAEGAMLDWSAVFMKEARAAAASRAGWGFAAFSLAMTVGRLTGDRFVQAFGAKKTLFYGALLGAVGYALAVFLPWEWTSLAGFIFVGIGLSNIVPVLFTLAGSQKAMPLSLALASVCTLGYLGILVGPAIIGFVAHATTLPFSFLLVALGLLGVALCARLKFR